MSEQSSPERSSEPYMDSKMGKIEKANDGSSHNSSAPNGVSKATSPSKDGPKVSNPAHPPTSNGPSRKGSTRFHSEEDDEDVVGGDVTIKMENGNAPKISQSPKKKVKAKKPQKFFDEPDMTDQAISSFERILACTYANKYFGITDKFMECDCVTTPNESDSKNHACDEDSDCINRATKMECIDACNCGPDCQNRRFQNKSYADVSVIKTDKKGYGLRANTDLKSESLIYEYIGEVVGEKAFRARMAQYDREGIKHFYFMSLNQGEFIDATKRGNLGRFCNHSCNPNCEVVKWIVGDRLRMGIFSQRAIEAGEELTFNYNVDRYGADAQKCFCGEPNCKKYIGGKTQTDHAASLSTLTIEALGLGDVDEVDDDVPKKPRKQKTGEDDDEYVERIKPKVLTEHAVEKVMASFLQQKEKWVIAKLLSRLQQCNEEKVLGRVVRMHGYKILKVVLASWVDDKDISLQILDVLHKLPRLTRNKIHDSGIEDSVRTLLGKEDELVRERSQSILDIWGALEMGYRIPRIQKDPNAGPERDPRRYRQRSRSPVRARSRSPELPGARPVPTGPKGNIPQRKPFFGNARPPPRRPAGPPPLPEGWAQATSDNGKVYYYSMMGHTTWERPTRPVAPPPAPPPVMTEQRYSRFLLDDAQRIVEEEQRLRAEAVKNKQQAASARSAEAGLSNSANGDYSTARADSSSSHKKQAPEKEPYWKKLNTEQRKKVYEKTIAPCLRAVVNEFYKKLEKDRLKEFARQCSKKITESDFKNGRVVDPTQIDSRHQHKIRKHAREFFHKAVIKKNEHHEREKKKAQTSGTEPNSKCIGTSNSMSPVTSPPPLNPAEMRRDSFAASSVDVTENGKEFSESPSSGSKRKRNVDETPLSSRTPGDEAREEGSPPKKRRSAAPMAPQEIPPPPPPPPPPPAEENVDKDGDSPMGEDEEEYSPTLEGSGKTNGPVDHNSSTPKVSQEEAAEVDHAANLSPQQKAHCPANS